MINRNLIRIRIVQIVYSWYQNSNNNLKNAEKELLQGFQKSYDLYFYLLLLKQLITIQSDAIKGENQQWGFCSAYALQNWLIKFSNDNLKLNGAAKMADDLLVIKQNNDEKLKI